MQHTNKKSPRKPGKHGIPEIITNDDNEQQNLPRQSDQPSQSRGQPLVPMPDQQQCSTTSSKLAGKWKQQVGAAKINWSKITDNELLETEGRTQQLAGLVQERYAVSREIAEKQVQEFMDNYKQ